MTIGGVVTQQHYARTYIIVIQKPKFQAYVGADSIDMVFKPSQTGSSSSFVTAFVFSPQSYTYSLF